MDEAQIHNQIADLIEEEHRLRDLMARREIGADEEHARLTELEASLDQCWDLLRQRMARGDAGEDPDNAGPRPVDVVENYQQ